MAGDLDAFACPSCGETLYAHVIAFARNGDFTCPSCGGASNRADVVDLAAAHNEKHHKAAAGRGKKAASGEED